MGIRQITQEEAFKIIETREPIGIFYEVDRDRDVFVGIDNSTGEAWVEEFETRGECWDWLREEKEEYLTELQRKQVRIMDHYGEDRQLEKLVEECAELIKAIMKSKIEKAFYINNAVIQEMADVKNLMRQFELKQGALKRTIDFVVERKVDRELKRIHTEKAKLL